MAYHSRAVPGSGRLPRASRVSDRWWLTSAQGYELAEEEVKISLEDFILKFRSPEDGEPR